MNVFGFALKWRECRIHIQYKDCGLTVGLAEEFLPSMRYSRITENTGSMALAKIEISKQRDISKGEIKDKTLWFQSTTSFRFLVSVDHFIPSSATHSSVNFCPILKT